MNLLELELKMIQFKFCIILYFLTRRALKNAQYKLSLQIIKGIFIN